MFGPLGVPEILFILVLALLIFGPRRLPDVGRTLGKAMGEFRRASTELKRSINTEIALEDEDERPRYTRTARQERGDGEDGERPAAGEETARDDEAPPRREDGAGVDLGRWTREGGGAQGGGADGADGEAGGEAGVEKAAPQPGTVPRGSAGTAHEPGGAEGAAEGRGADGGDPGDGSEGGGADGDRGPGA